jgi:hypothetical protein
MPVLSVDPQEFQKLTEESTDTTGGIPEGVEHFLK